MAIRVAPRPQPISIRGGDVGVVCLHGFTGAPSTLHALALALGQAGFSVEVPLLPGHGTSPADLEPLGWTELAGAAEEALRGLQSRTAATMILGFSLGATLAGHLAINDSSVLGLVSINGMFAVPPGAVEELRAGFASGQRFIPAGETDCRDPEGVEACYEEMPLRTMMSIAEHAPTTVFDRLAEIRCPVLAVRSEHDATVSSASFDELCSGASGPVEQLVLPQSGHLAPMDLDRELLVTRTLEFFRRISGDVGA